MTAKIPRPRSAIEELFWWQVSVELAARGRVERPIREYAFCPGRRWRFDFAWPRHKVALECEGGHWTGGRHVRGAGFEADCEKYSEAAALGWRVIRATGQMVRDGRALAWVERLITADAPQEPQERPEAPQGGRQGPSLAYARAPRAGPTAALLRRFSK